MTEKWTNFSKSFLICSILSLLITTLIIFVVFAMRTILDPMYRNPQIISQTRQIFHFILMPFYLLEDKFVGLNPDGSHRFHIIWTPLGMIFSVLYISVGGNLIRIFYSIIRRKTKKTDIE